MKMFIPAVLVSTGCHSTTETGQLCRFGVNGGNAARNPTGTLF